MDMDFALPFILNSLTALPLTKFETCDALNYIAGIVFHPISVKNVDPAVKHEMTSSSPFRHYRLHRVAELATVNRTACAVHRSRRGHNRNEPWPLLVGKFLTKRDAERLFPEAGLNRLSPAIYFCDCTGALPCEFLTFERAWLGLTVCLTEWNITPALWARRVLADGEERILTAEEGFVYLEIIASPYMLPPGHFLSSIWKYEFTAEECDPVTEALQQKMSENAELSANQLLDKYKPVLVDLSQNTNPGPHTSRDLMRFPELRNVKLITMHGIVRAKSNLTHAGEQRCFFVELKWETVSPSGNEQPNRGSGILQPRTVLTVFVLYRDRTSSSYDLLPYFENIRVGSRYLLADLKPSQIKVHQADGKEIKKKLLLFSVPDSKMFCLDGLSSTKDMAGFSLIASDHTQQRITPTKFPLNAMPQRPTEPSECRNVSPSEARRSQILSYTGEVTAVIDVASGVYELDRKYLLYATFYYSPCLGRGIRVGCEIELQNVHMVIDGFEVPRSQYARHHRRKQAVVFIACSYSNLRIRRFSEYDNVCYICPPQQRKIIVDSWRMLSIPDLLLAGRLRDYINSMSTTVNRAADSKPASAGTVQWSTTDIFHILEHFGFTPLPTARQPTVLNHDDDCQLASLRYPIPHIVTIADIRKTPELIDSLTTGSSAFQAGWAYRIFNQCDLSMENAYLIAYLESDLSGYLRVRDASGTLLVVLDSILTSSDIGRLWLFKRFRVVGETLGSVGFPAFTTPVYKLYLECTKADAICLDDSRPAPPMPLLGNVHNGQSGLGYLFLVQHKCVPGVHITQDGAVELITTLEGLTWTIKGSWLQAEYRSTFFEIAVKCINMGQYVETSELCYIVNAEDVTPEGKEEMSAPDLYLKATLQTRLSKVTICSDGNIDGGLIVSAAGQRAEAIRIQLGAADIKRIEMEREPSVFRSIGAVVSRHLEMQMDNDEFTDYLVSVEGVVQSRDFRDVEADPLLSPSLACELFEKYTIGTGKSDRIITIRLRDVGGQDAIDIYLDLRFHRYPLRMIPGTLMRFRKLVIRRSNRGTVYGQFIAETSVTAIGTTVHELSGPPSDAAGPQLLFKLIDFFSLNIAPQTPLPVKCTITFIQEVHLYYMCLMCHSKPSNESCPNNCPRVHQALYASARVFGEDGTSETLLYIDDPDAVFALLQVKSSKAEDDLKKLIRRTGDVRFAQDPPWFAKNDQEMSNGEGTVGERDAEARDAATAAAEAFLTACCQRTNLLRPVIIRCRRVRRHSDKAGRAEKEEITRRTFKANEGQIMPTMAYTRLVLKVLSIEEVNVRNEAARLITLLSNNKP